jgi:kelch-like protein 2/3
MSNSFGAHSPMRRRASDVRASDVSAAVVESTCVLPAAVANITVKYARLRAYYVLGGVQSMRGVATVDRYDAHSGTWNAVAPMRRVRRLFGACCVDGLVYAVGGYDGDAGGKMASVECYDPSVKVKANANAWNDVAPVRVARFHHAVCALNGCVYALGGIVSNHAGTPTASVEMYNPTTNQWTDVAPMIIGRSGHTACVLDGCIFVAGGRNLYNHYMACGVEKYDPATNEWTFVAPMRRARSSHAMAVLDGQLYVAGGYTITTTRHYRRSVERYNEAASSSDVWSSDVADMARNRFCFGMTAANGQLTVIGGTAASWVNDDDEWMRVEQYDAPTDAWSVVSSASSTMRARRRHYFAFCVEN